MTTPEELAAEVTALTAENELLLLACSDLVTLSEQVAEQNERLLAAIKWHRTSTLYQKRGTTQHDITLWNKCLEPLPQRDPWPNAH